MASSPRTTTLLLISGPIAAGKSAVSRRLAEEMRADGRSVALVELDAIADMARPTLPDWADAHRTFAAVVAQWLKADLDVVIAESVSDREELTAVLDGAPAGTKVLTVVITCPFETALERALADPTRGISRDPSFLCGVHERWARESIRFPAHVVLDTSVTPLEDCVVQLREAMADSETLE